ncbi:hypothetical protein [Haliangium sp.]
MFTGLKVTVELTGMTGKPKATKTYTAIELLALMQQSLPGTTKPTGDGTLTSPYRPSKPSEWFYCAKMKREYDAELVSEKTKNFVLYTKQPTDKKKTKVEVEGTGVFIDRYGSREVPLGTSKSLIRSTPTSMPVSTWIRFRTDDTGKGWFVIGKRLVGIDPGSLYSSDYGVYKANTSVVPSIVFKDTSYRNIWDKLKTSCTNKLGNKKVARQLREMLMNLDPVGAPPILPILTSTLFVSEVARNHTAFHTNLMALDLIQAPDGVETNMSLSSKVGLTWALALWQEEDYTCPNCKGSKRINCSRCSGTGWSVKPKYCGCIRGKVWLTCRSCRGSGWYGDYECRGCYGQGGRNVQCRACNGTTVLRRGVVCANRDCKRGSVSCPTCWNNKKFRSTGKLRHKESDPKGFNKLNKKISGGGSKSLQAGLLAMSHTGSAWGSAFDLTGKGAYYGVYKDTYGTGKLNPTKFDPLPTKLSIVRRKEATILIRWLASKLVQLKESPLAGHTKVRFETVIDDGDITLTDNDFAKAYENIDDEKKGLVRITNQARFDYLEDLLARTRGVPSKEDDKMPQKKLNRKEVQEERDKLEQALIIDATILHILQHRCDTFKMLL